MVCSIEEGALDASGSQNEEQLKKEQL